MSRRGFKLSRAVAGSGFQGGFRHVFEEGVEVLLFSGTFELNLDEKFRVTLPRQLYDRFRERCGLEEQVMLTPNFGGCIAVRDYQTWQAQALAYAEQSGTEDGYLAHEAFTSASHLVRLDAQRRLLVAPMLRDIAGLTPSCAVTVKGVGDHVDIWLRERVEERFGDALKALIEKPPARIGGGPGGGIGVHSASATAVSEGLSAGLAAGHTPQQAGYVA